MSKNLCKLLAVVMALAMVFSLAGMAFAEGDTRLAAEVFPELFDANAYNETSSEIYEEVLGEFYELYTEAKAAESNSERWALMAQAEAKLLSPLSSRFRG